MNELADRLLDSICHRGGPHADLLPLCLRCSSVYAGVIAGAAFELAVRMAARPYRPSNHGQDACVTMNHGQDARATIGASAAGDCEFAGRQLAARRGSGRAALVLNAVGLAVMGAVGLGALYGLFAVPDAVKIFTALWFGAAIAFFAAEAMTGETWPRTERSEASLFARMIVLAGFAGWAACAGAGETWALRAIGALALPGVAVAFIGVNFAFALVLLRRLRGRAIRFALSGLAVAVLAAGEFGLFVLWRGY